MCIYIKGAGHIRKQLPDITHFVVLLPMMLEFAMFGLSLAGSHQVVASRLANSITITTSTSTNNHMLLRFGTRPSIANNPLPTISTSRPSTTKLLRLPQLQLGNIVLRKGFSLRRATGTRLTLAI